MFVSRGGALVTGVQAPRTRLIWLGRDGVTRPISPELRDFASPRLSPDGRRLAVLITEAGKRDIWIYDLDTGTLSRLTNLGTVTSAEWTHDGSHVVYAAPGSTTHDAIWSQSVGNATESTGAAQAVVALAHGGHRARRPLPAAAGLRGQRAGTCRASRSTRTRCSGRSTPPDASDLSPHFSPDGRWAALQSGESGASEVYVRSFPEPTVKVQVSVGGGGGPVWSADGTRLYYAAGGGVIMEARLSTTSGLRVLSRDTAFTRVPNAIGGFGQPNYDVSHDGSRIVVPSAQSTAYPLVVVPNWRTELRQKLAANRK